MLLRQRPLSIIWLGSGLNSDTNIIIAMDNYRSDTCGKSEVRISSPVDFASLDKPGAFGIMNIKGRC